MRMVGTVLIFRAALITPLVDRKLYDEAASLAEKYLEFDALVSSKKKIVIRLLIIEAGS